MPITDVDCLPPLDIKFQNLYFLDNRQHEYQYEGSSYEGTRRRIMNVRNGDLREVTRGLPRNVSLVQQGAHWMRAMVGMHFFPDANH